MRLLEYEGKKLFKKYGIPVPDSTLVTSGKKAPALTFPIILKSQVPIGNRGRLGGIISIKSKKGFGKAAKALFGNKIAGYTAKKLLAEEKIVGGQELYLSFSYSTEERKPVLAISAKGGSDIEAASIFPIDITWGLPDFYLRNACAKANLVLTPHLRSTIKSLWELFTKEHALLAEINPLFHLENKCIAGDAKIILDDNVVDPTYRPLLNLTGDIAILASGGGASLTNLDALMRHGGRPANYVEYSGNPKAEVVEALTKKVLSRKGLKGCWVIGGTANFTDIYETLLGLVNGLRQVKPKPTYPIVIRRDGPRTQEAFAMLREVGKKEDYNFHLYDSATSMSDSGKVMTQLAYRTLNPKP